MTVHAESTPDLDSVRASAQYASLTQLRPHAGAERFELFARLDPHFARTWTDYTGGLLARRVLDVRTMLLVLCGQYTMLNQLGGLRDALTAGINEGVDGKEMLEAILQCYVYGGDEIVADAAGVFTEVMDQLGVLDDIVARGLPVDANLRDRDLAREREQWSAQDRDDPALAPLLDRYGWLGLSNGLRLRPGSTSTWCGSSTHSIRSGRRSGSTSPSTGCMGGGCSTTRPASCALSETASPPATPTSSRATCTVRCGPVPRQPRSSKWSCSPAMSLAILCLWASHSTTRCG